MNLKNDTFLLLSEYNKECIVVGVMKMGNIVPREGIEPTSLAFRASVLTITTHRLPWCHYYTHAYLSMYPLCLRGQCRLLHSSLWNCKPFNTLQLHTYRQSPHIYEKGRFNNHTAHSLYKILVMETSVLGVMKIGNIVPRAGIKSTSLAFHASMLSITPHGLPWCHH